MTDRSYAITGAGFTLQGTIDEARLHLLVRLLDKAARKLDAAKRESPPPTRDDVLEVHNWSEGRDV